MLKKAFIFLMLISLFSANTYAMNLDNKGEFKKVYLADTNETYLIEESERFKGLKKPVIAVAFGGGGARGFVNIGVLKALDEARIPVDMITGTSMGAVAAVLYGSGLPVKEIEKIFSADILQSLIDVNFPFIKSFLTSKKLNYILQEVTPVNRLENFAIPTALLSLDLTKEARLIRTKGEVKNVIQGSYAIPIIFPVARYKNSYLVDPGILELTPACTAKLLGADIIISTTAYDKLPYNTYNLPFQAWMKMINVIKEENSQRIVNRYSDVVLKHEVGNYSHMDFTLSQKFIDMGYKLTKEKMPEIREILSKNHVSYKGHVNNDNKTNVVDVLLEDIKNDRVIYNFTEFKPIFSYGKDDFTFNKGYFKKKLHKVQYGLEIEHRNKEVMFILEGGSGDNYEFKTRIKKITPSLDFQLLCNNNQSSHLYDLLFLNYKDHFTIGAGFTIKENKTYLHFKNKYDFKINNTEVKGNINVLQATNSINDVMNESVFENELIFPVNPNRAINMKCVAGKTNILSIPYIYRGVIPREKPALQYSIELENNYQFNYSYEIMSLFQISGLDFYQFIDYIDYDKHNYAIGSGLDFDLNLFGIKPMTFGGYLSYDLNNKSYQIGMEVDISL